MKKYIIYVLFFALSSCNYNTELMKPIDGMHLGMSKEKALSKIAFYKQKGMIFDSNKIIIEGDTASISFHYCQSCFGQKLEGITLRSTKSQKLYNKLTMQLKDKDYEVKVHLIGSYEFIPYVDTLICIYTDKMEYHKFFTSFTCKNQGRGPCWKYLFIPRLL